MNDLPTFRYDSGSKSLYCGPLMITTNLEGEVTVTSQLQKSVRDVLAAIKSLAQAKTIWHRHFADIPQPDYDHLHGNGSHGRISLTATAIDSVPMRQLSALIPFLEAQNPDAVVRTLEIRLSGGKMETDLRIIPETKK